MEDGNLAASFYDEFLKSGMIQIWHFDRLLTNYSGIFFKQRT
jgi:hypothetical protein